MILSFDMVFLKTLHIIERKMKRFMWHGVIGAAT